MELRRRQPDAVGARRRRLPALLCGLLILLLAAAPARADDLRQPASQTRPPAYHRLSADTVIAIADRVPKVRAERRLRGSLRPVAYMKGLEQWQVSYFQGRIERAQVLIDDATGRVREAWTGPQVAWTMARGYPGAFAGKVSALYVWLPLSALFLAPFLDLRRPRRLLHLDLLVLLALGLSLAFFNHALIGVSVPLVYPVLVYLAVRLSLAGLRPRPSTGRLLPHVRVTWLALGLVFLVCFRLALNIADSGVVDIGYASMVGGDRIAHGETLYGAFPSQVAHGDTYGPVTYLLYVPFARVFGFSGRWDALPGAHAAAISFDLLTMAGLFLLGRRMRAGPAGLELGTALAYAWASFPFTFYALDSNTNDGLVALLLVAALLAFGSRPGRTALVALAGAAKFAPLLLVPLFATARASGSRAKGRSLIVGGAAAVLVLAATFLPFMPHGGLRALWERTVGYQGGRDSPFSIWGEHPSLHWLLVTLEASVGAFAVAVALLPGRREMRACAGLGAALLIGVQLCATYWFYLYVVWFLPFALVAIMTAYRTRDAGHSSLPPLDERAREPVLT